MKIKFHVEVTITYFISHKKLKQESKRILL